MHILSLIYNLFCKLSSLLPNNIFNIRSSKLPTSKTKWRQLPLRSPTNNKIPKSNHESIIHQGRCQHCCNFIDLIQDLPRPKYFLHREYLNPNSLRYFSCLLSNSKNFKEILLLTNPTRTIDLRTSYLSNIKWSSHLYYHWAKKYLKSNNLPLQEITSFIRARNLNYNHNHLLLSTGVIKLSMIQVSTANFKLINFKLIKTSS